MGKKKKKKIFVSNVNSHQRVPSAEENFHHQMDKMTYYIYASQPLSPITPLILQWPHEQSAYGGRGDSYTRMKVMMMKLINMHFHSPRLIQLWPQLSAQSACR